MRLKILSWAARRRGRRGLSCEGRSLREPLKWRRLSAAGLVRHGCLNPVVAATFGRILGPPGRHSQDAPWGVPVACSDAFKVPRSGPDGAPFKRDYLGGRKGFARASFGGARAREYPRDE